VVNHPNRSKNILRPVEHLRIASTLYPQAWKQFDHFRQLRGGELPDWPEWCYCPLAAAYAIVSGGGNNRVQNEEAGRIAALGALAAWRATQTIYRFDPAVAAELEDTPIDLLPADVLYRLPEWCVYIEHDSMWYDQRMAGFFAHLEYDIGTGRPELRLLIDCDDDQGLQTVIGVPIHINQPTLAAALESMVSESRRQAIDHGSTLVASALPHDLGSVMAVAVRPLLGLLLYLCSECPDLGEFIPSRPQPKRTKKGWRLFPPDAPQVVTVGSRIGAELRRAYHDDQVGASDRQGPRPHIRRAHWHTYRTGTGRTIPILRWISPIAVGMAGDGTTPVTIKEVKP